MWRTCWSTVLWRNCNFLFQIYFRSWRLPLWNFPIQFLFQEQRRHRSCYSCVVCMYVQQVKKKSFPLHYANAQSLTDGGLYHCNCFYSGLCLDVMRRRKWQCTFVWGLPEESRMPCVCSTQCQVRYCVCVQNIVCVPHCYLRKRPGPSPRFSLF